jgi:nucleotide-binding universal stress UspA family protein
MINVSRILCPTDLTTESDEALRYAIALACAYKAKLMLLYCREPGSVVEWTTASQAARLFELSLFTHLDAKERRALDWEAVITEGDDKGLAIVTEAAKRNADLIVMRSRRRPRAAVLLGSTAEAVSRNASCPVLVTHPNEREWAGLSTNEIDLRRLLIPYDSSSDAEVALSYGLSLAQQYQAEVHLLYVIPEENVVDPEIDWAAAVEHEDPVTIAALGLKRAIPKEAFLWCKIVTAVRCGQPADEIRSYATEQKIDLICMGAGDKRFSLGSLIGSTVDRVLRRAPCPVLVSRPTSGAAASTKAA